MSDRDAADYLRLSPSGTASASDFWRYDGAIRAFGGQIIAHAIMSCGRHVPAGFSLHSIHLHFLKPGSMVETDYVIKPLRVGRSYAVYQAIAVESGDKHIASAVLSFCKKESGPWLHADVMPTTLLRPPPTEPLVWPSVVPADDSGRRWYVSWSPELDGSGAELNASSPPLAHAAALAFLSDHYFLASGFMADARVREAFDLNFMASLDHAFFLHEPSFDASRPMLYESDCTYAASGRALVRGKLWAVDSGKLIASTVQEGVLRAQAKTEATALEHSRL